MKDLGSSEFKKNICHNCLICQPGDRHSEFCETIYSMHPAEFLTGVVRIGKLYMSSKELSYTFMRSFTAFTEIFCESGICPARSNKCKANYPKTMCYNYWTFGMDSSLDDISKNALLIHCQQDRLNYMDKRHILTDAWNNLRKKKKKRIMKWLTKQLKKVVDTEKKSKAGPTKANTSIFYSNNERWSTHVKAVIGAT